MSIASLNESELELTPSLEEIRCYQNASSPANRTGKPKIIEVTAFTPRTSMLSPRGVHASNAQYNIEAYPTTATAFCQQIRTIHPSAPLHSLTTNSGFSTAPWNWFQKTESFIQSSSSSCS